MRASVCGEIRKKAELWGGEREGRRDERREGREVGVDREGERRGEGNREEREGKWNREDRGGEREEMGKERQWGTPEEGPGHGVGRVSGQLMIPRHVRIKELPARHKQPQISECRARGCRAAGGHGGRRGLGGSQAGTVRRELSWAQAGQRRQKWMTLRQLGPATTGASTLRAAQATGRRQTNNGA